MGQIAKGLDYLKSLPCILKIAEIYVLLIAFSLAGHFLNESTEGFFTYVGKKGNIEFFLFATIVGWLIAITCVVVFVVGIHEKISVPWTLVLTTVAALWTILLLISSALLAAAVKHYDDTVTIVVPIGLLSTVKVEYNACKQLKDSNANPQCGHLIGATTIGFIGTVLYAVDWAIHAYMFLTGRSNQTSGVAPV